MDSAQELPAERTGRPATDLSYEAVVTILWETAWNALIRAFIIQLLGSIAISMVGEMFKEMTPTLPPGFTPATAGEIPTFPASRRVGAFIAQNQFWIIFAFLFLAMTAFRFSQFLRAPEHRRLAARLLVINRRISGHWFSLFVMNGFVAWISAMVFIALQQFSWTQIIWSVIGTLLQPLVHVLGGMMPGAGMFEHWYSWYGQNQAKFIFWLCYSAAICDDLGLPNYKTLIRWGGRRLKRYFRARLNPNVPPVTTRSGQ